MIPSENSFADLQHVWKALPVPQLQPILLIRRQIQRQDNYFASVVSVFFIVITVDNKLTTTLVYSTLLVVRDLLLDIESEL